MQNQGIPHQQKLDSYISRMTLDNNKGVYLSDTPSYKQALSNTSNVTEYPQSGYNLTLLLVIIILILTILAYYKVNLFTITGNIFQWFSDTITPFFINIMKFFGLAVGETTIAATTVASTGVSAATYGIDAVNQGVTNTVVSGVQTTLSNPSISTYETSLPQQKTQNVNEASFHIVNTAPQMVAQEQKEDDKQYSNDVQYNTPMGYCFIGEQNHLRYCAEVSDAHQCASGDIFPTQDLCVNPNMRMS